MGRQQGKITSWIASAAKTVKVLQLKDPFCKSSK
jgi:hypothetical protein